MNKSDLLVGTGLAAYGLAFYGLARWYVSDEQRIRRVAERRWGFDRFTTRKLRSGEMSQEEWFEKFIKSQRGLVKWGFTPFTVLWIGLCVATVIRGLSGS